MRAGPGMGTSWCTRATRIFGESIRKLILPRSGVLSVSTLRLSRPFERHDGGNSGRGGAGNKRGGLRRSLPGFAGVRFCSLFVGDTSEGFAGVKTKNKI